MRKELMATVVALVLAFVAVQGAGLLQTSPIMVGGKADYAATEPGARVQATQLQPSPRLPLEQAVGIVLVPLIIAAFCYLLARRKI